MRLVRKSRENVTCSFRAHSLLDEDAFNLEIPEEFIKATTNKPTEPDWTIKKSDRCIPSSFAYFLEWKRNFRSRLMAFLPRFSGRSFSFYDVQDEIAVKYIAGRTWIYVKSLDLDV